VGPLPVCRQRPRGLDGSPCPPPERPCAGRRHRGGGPDAEPARCLGRPDPDMADPGPLPPWWEGRLDTAGDPGSGACLGLAVRRSGARSKTSEQSLLRRPSGQPPHSSDEYSSVGPPPLQCGTSVGRTCRSVTGEFRRPAAARCGPGGRTAGRGSARPAGGDGHQHERAGAERGGRRLAAVGTRHSWPFHGHRAVHRD
jgi:hypothetical protein